MVWGLDEGLVGIGFNVLIEIVDFEAEQLVEIFDGGNFAGIDRSVGGGDGEGYMGEVFATCGAGQFETLAEEVKIWGRSEEPIEGSVKESAFCGGDFGIGTDSMREVSAFVVTDLSIGVSDHTSEDEDSLEVAT